MRVRLLLFFAAFRIAARLSWAPKRTRALPIALASFLLLGCGVRLTALPDDREDYLRYVAFRGPGNDKFLLRWPTGKMPLEVYLPPPLEGLFADPQSIHDAARAGVTNWTDAARPGLPSFTFVDSAGDADIPIAWAEQSPSYSIAHCFYAVDLYQRRFGVAQILVTGHYRDGTTATPEEVHLTVLHEMGHALGLAGHSPNPEDIMYGFPIGRNLTKLTRALLRDEIRPGETMGLTHRDRATIRTLYEKPIGARVAGAKRAY